MSTLLALFLTITLVGAQTPLQSASLTTNPCHSKQTCSECIRTPTCAWCAQPNFTKSDDTPLPRCNQQTRYANDQLLKQCEHAYLIFPKNEQYILQDHSLSKATQSHEAVQIRPQHVRLKLRINEGYDLDLRYAQAEDYPVDLYYLMDLSKSMADDKERLSGLGNLLAESMRNITSNFRLGFGSFVDKVVMPYVSTVKEKLERPCDQCVAPYGFKNHMPLNTSSESFSHEVQSAAVSGNLDAPEGGFDAIMQAVVCQTEIGWREKARHLLVFSTDDSFHHAGDGKLGGIVKPNDGECHMDDITGLYTHSKLQDYPSVSQINQVVKKKSVNVIFAVTRDQVPIYRLLTEKIEGSYAGELSNDSSNVVDLVREQYMQITSSIEMKDNVTSSSNLRITYFSSCLTGRNPIETSRCDGLRVGDVVRFTAKIEATSCPDNPADWHQWVKIYPVGVSETLIVEVDLQCECDCEKPGHEHYIPKADVCSGHGAYKCGICDCEKQYFGRRCECDNDYSGNMTDIESGCRPDNKSDTPLCSGRGSCVCGVCECHTRPNSNEAFSGPFCECDNFSCDRHNGILCSGEDHGECQCGKCICKPGWMGDACNCRASNATCIPHPGGEICSGHGECVCGVCRCEETESGRYSGKYCQDCPACPGQCDEFKPCVQCQVFQSGELTEEQCLKCNFTPIEVKVAEEERETDRVCTFLDDDNCRVTYVYGYDEEGHVVVRVQETKECPAVLDILGIVLGVIGAVVAVGLALLLLWKLYTTIHDRREFAKFENERKMAKWDTGVNPIFKQATSTFKNPTYGGK